MIYTRQFHYWSAFCSFTPLNDEFPEYENYYILGAESDLRKDKTFVGAKLIDKYKEAPDEYDFLFIFSPEDAAKSAENLGVSLEGAEPISAERFIFLIVDHGVKGRRLEGV